MNDVVKKPRGLATLSPERRREIARMGGKSVPADKRAFAVNRELASKAGRKGNKNLRDEKRAFSVDPALASRAGKLGAKSRAAAKAKK